MTSNKRLKAFNYLLGNIYTNHSIIYSYGEPIFEPFDEKLLIKRIYETKAGVIMAEVTDLNSPSPNDFFFTRHIAIYNLLENYKQLKEAK